jgi:hypothetical protein
MHLGAPAREALWDYSQGPLALVPALELLITLRALGAAGEWGSRQVLAVGLGMTLSVIISAGFVQAMSRRTSICLAFDDIASATRFLRGVLAMAGVCVTLVGLVVVAVASRLGAFTAQEVITFGLAFVGMSAIWLLAAGLSLLRASAWLGVGLAAGLALGALVDRALAPFTSAHLAPAALVGFVVTVAVLAWQTRRGMRRRCGHVRRREALPPAPYLMSEAAPYFAYGTLYALLLFTPHVVGWLAALASSEPRVWAVASLEAGFTLALPPVILAGGVAEHTLQLFWQRALLAQTSTSGADPEHFRRVLRRYYLQQLVRYLVVLSSLTVLAGLAFRSALDSGLLAAWVGIDRLDVLERVFMGGLLAYWLLGWGVFNCMFSLSLARPRLALLAVLPGLICTLFVAVPVSIVAGFAYMGIAAIVGSAVYVVSSCRTTTSLFRGLDYYYATAF